MAYKRFDELELETFLVRVIKVTSRNDWGAIFNCDLIDIDGNTIDFKGDYFQVRALRKGLATDVKQGQWWYVTGKTEYTKYPDENGVVHYGTTLHVEVNGAEMLMPSGRAIVDYIAMHEDIHRAGHDKARKLWEAFQEKLFELLDNGDVKTLSKVDGVGSEVCERIVNAWKADGLGYQLQWLQSHDIPYSIGKKALDYFGEQMVQSITQNPYVLLPFSASWRAVDKLARDVIGIEVDDPRRLEAALHEACYRRMSKGHTFVRRKWLMNALKNRTSGLLNDINEDIDECIVTALRLAHEAGRLFFDSKGNAYPVGSCLLENNIVDAIKARRSVEPSEFDVSGLIHNYEQEQGHGFALNKEQREAVSMVARNNFSVLTGGAGCGKTTVLKVVFEVLEQQGYDIVQLALAGKAAKRMSEATGRPAQTIASYVCAKNREAKSDDDNQMPLVEDEKIAVVIDEASMVDLLSMNRLLDHLPPLCKIVLVGDPNQLAPVGPGLILHALTEFDKVPHTRLLVANRFGSDILEVAESVLQGVFPVEFNDSVTFEECGAYSMTEMAGDMLIENLDDSIVLCARRKEVGFINNYVQERLTKKEGKLLTVYSEELDLQIGQGLYLNDPVICTSNRYDWGLQNGSMGRIVEIFDRPQVLDSDEEHDEPALGWIEWDDGEKRPIRLNLLDDLNLAYALTIHKSQGSQWKRVILALATNDGKDVAPNSMLDRSLVYTGITRAQSKVEILGTHRHISQSVRKVAYEERDVALLPRLQHQIAA